MTALRIVAIAVGGLAVASRGMGLIAPDVFRRFAMVVTRSRPGVRVLGVVSLALGAYTWWLVSESHPPDGPAALFRILAAVWILFGPVALISPGAVEALTGSLVVLSSRAFLRLLCAVGVAIGAALIWLGVFVLAPA
jgi:hypothetical protein